MIFKISFYYTIINVDQISCSFSKFFNRKFKRNNIHLKWKHLSFWNIMNVFNVIFGQFIAE